MDASNIPVQTKEVVSPQFDDTVVLPLELLRHGTRVTILQHNILVQDIRQVIGRNIYSCQAESVHYQMKSIRSRWDSPKLC